MKLEKLLQSRKLLFTTQKNEGRHLLEWIAYNRLIGFDDILIFSNDCVDGSDTMLDHLDHLNFCKHVSHTPTDLTPQKNAVQIAMSEGLFVHGDWIMWMDPDEYLYVNIGDHKVDDLIEHIGDKDMMYVAWRLFGDNGLIKWPGQHITEALTACQSFDPEREPTGKSIFRWSDKIESMSAHRPFTKPNVTREQFDAISSTGTRPTPFFGVKRGPRFSILLNGGEYWKLAQVNHYAVRTPDEYDKKARRGAGNPAASHNRTKYKPWFYRMHNTNEAFDDKILMFKDSVEIEKAKLRQQLWDLGDAQLREILTSYEFDAAPAQ
jgi:hypothetical protein